MTETAPDFRVTNESRAVSTGAPFAWWRCLHCGCDEYAEHVFTGNMSGVAMVHCVNCEALHSPPDPDSKSALRWHISELVEEVDALRKIISDIGYCAPDASLEFMRLIPAEVRAARSAQALPPSHKGGNRNGG